MGGREVNLNLDNVFKYTVFFFRVPLVTYSPTHLIKHLLISTLLIIPAPNHVYNYILGKK